MENKTEPIGEGITYAVGWHQHQLLEELIAEHMLLHVISGELRLFDTTSDKIYRAGETVFIQRNHLIKCGSRPLPGGTPYEIIVFILDQKLLQDYMIKNTPDLPGDGPTKFSGVVTLHNWPAFDSLFGSLDSYRKSGTMIPESLRRHKLEEAVLALLEYPLKLASIIFDFEEPGKIDLKAFMLRNYMFNIPISNFATLTGRSLSTFQRDFIKVFAVSASQWLITRRLEQAQQLLIQGRKPTEIYLELGFADLSHFSRSFKKAFGFPPSLINNKRPV